MWIDLLLLIAGIVLILYGANALTDGSAAIAKKCGMSELMAGLTIVAFGTSTPELVISLFSAFTGSSELAVGNVVGSNIFNVLVILGITAIVKPVKVENTVMTKEIPMVVLSAVALFAIGCSPYLDPSSSLVVTRVEGVLLLLFFMIFMRMVFAGAKSSSPDEPAAKNAGSKPEMSWTKAVLFVLLGLGALVFGGDLFVKGASGLASSLGVSEAVIGLTIVAAGSSLPELATSVAAALKGKPDIAIGNVIGSNIFNIFLVLGSSSLILPLKFGNISFVDFSVQLIAALLFWLFARFYKDKTVTRQEGSILVVCYVVYIVWIILNA